MSLIVSQFPKSEKINILSVDNVDGFARFLVSVASTKTNIKQYNKIGVFTDVYRGYFNVTSISQGTNASNSYVETDETYVSTATGFLISNLQIATGSKWNAVNETPIIIKLQRKDLLIDRTFSSGTLHIELLSSVPASFVAGVKFYLNSGGVYDGMYTVSSVPTSTIIKCAEAFISATTSGFINSDAYRDNYRSDVTIYSNNNEITNVYYPNLSGEIEINIQSILKSLLSIKDEFNFEDVSDQDFNISNSFYFSILEQYTGSTETTVDYTELFYYCLANIPLNQYSNMFKYVIKTGGTIPLADFLSIGLNTMYVNSEGKIMFPFSIEVLAQDGIVNKKEDTYNESKQLLSTGATEVLNASQNSLNRIRLSGDYSSLVKYIKMYLTESYLNIEHFDTAITETGNVPDTFSLQDGLLVDANCIVFESGGTSTITLPELIEVQNDTLTNDGTATLVTLNDNIIIDDGGTGGTVFNLQFEDQLGNQYIFPCVENYINIEKNTYLLSGVKIDINTLAETIVYAFASNDITFDNQQTFFWQALYGMTKNVNSSDNSEIIWTPKDRGFNEMYCIGLDDSNYTAGFAPIE